MIIRTSIVSKFSVKTRFMPESIIANYGNSVNICRNMKVLKFGGSSVGSPERVRDVKKIVENLPAGNVVVVSAFRGITDQLIKMGEMARMQDDGYKAEFDHLSERHIKSVKEVVQKQNQDFVLDEVSQMLKDLDIVLHGVYLLKELTLKTLDYILSFGERLSAFIISYAFDQAKFVDIREFIRTDSHFGNARVDFNLTNEMLKTAFSHFRDTVIVPGFVASNEEGDTTTLGRGGSDYTASIIAAALDAERLEIWTDVDGFMTADPRKVEKAYAVKHLTYAEAMELSHFGAKVLYTPTIKPVFQKNIPLVIKNTFNPPAPGTLISNKKGEADETFIKGISSIDNVDLVTLQGAGMVGVSGVSMRLFSALAKAKVNVIMITQASSEYSITFAINPLDTKKAVKSIEHEFAAEIEVKEIRVHIERELSIIAIVGEKMKNTPGISANLFRSLGRNGINVVATAQGSSELNISVVVQHKALKKALNVIHEGFFLSHYKELHLYVIGIGTVGRSLLSQIEHQKEKLMKQHKLKINLAGIANSRKMLVDKNCIDIRHYLDSLEKLGERTDLHDFVKQMTKMNLRNSVFVDCTASEQVTALYPMVLNSYASIVTANKIAASSEYEFYRNLKSTALDKNVRFIFETNVGAGLPIINTINDLIRSGDKILKLEAVLSGTLNFIFNEISSDVKLSKAVKMAQEKGFSEPDPRIDLSGVDVLRKLLILSREAGYKLEKKDVQIKSFLPESCFKGSLDDFWAELKKIDTEFENKRKKLEEQNKKWRYVARLDNGDAGIELMEVDFMHPSYSLEGSNNIILITTERYNEQPMIIKGYGAGAEVTAAGVFADIIRIANV